MNNIISFKIMINRIKKLIPAYLEVRSLFWVEYGNRLESALVSIFNAIDEDRYDDAEKLIDAFESQFSQSNVPHWVAIKYSEIYRAKSMLNFLSNISLD